MSAVYHYDIEQGSPEWFALRLGVPTASEFGTVLAKGEGKTRRTYMLKLLGERMSGEPTESYTNVHMERGKAMEAEARDAYSLLSGNAVVPVGFVRNGEVGASPDSVVGENGCVEIKTKLPHLLLDVLLQDRLPPEHVAQVQGQLWVCEREWCDFVAYWPKLPPFIKRIRRDEQYIAELASGVDRFLSEMNDLHAKLNARYITMTEAA